MKKFIFSILTLSAVITSCNTDLDINRNPDNLDPNDAELSAQLPAGIVGLAGSEGAGMAIFGGFWAQYWTQSNTANQFKDIDNYSAGTADYNFVWNGMFDALGDIRNIKRRALAEGNWNYYLIATTLEVQASQLLTDYYGDIPYEEASLSSNLTPHFNTGEEVYDLMIQDLDDALSKDLSTSNGALPDDHDLIFQGDMAKWTAFANTLKLKVYMRQTYSSRAAIADAGITALLASGVTFLNEDAGIDVFIDEINQSNPLYEYIERRLNVATNLRASNTLFSYLTANGDTRKPFYYEAGNALPQGDYNSSASNIAVVNLHAETPVYFMTKEESLFLQAEAAERYSGGTGAQAFYNAAVTANFARYGLTPILTGAYAYPTGGTAAQKLEAIITQKWIAAFPGNGFEAFFDQNRTGYPTLSYSVNGSTGTLFPRRIVYPLSERNANPNTPALVPITTPVWWDN